MRVTRIGVFLSLLRIRGIPPLVNFFPKIFIFLQAWRVRGVVIPGILLMGSSVFIFIYLRIGLSFVSWMRRSTPLTLWGEARVLTLLALRRGGLVF